VDEAPASVLGGGAAAWPRGEHGSAAGSVCLGVPHAAAGGDGRRPGHWRRGILRGPWIAATAASLAGFTTTTAVQAGIGLRRMLARFASSGD
jgi:hypothetical protein